MFTAISEQWASPGSQARSEGTEGQSDTGSPPGALLQRLAALFHHQHGSGEERDPDSMTNVVNENKKERGNMTY